MSDQIAPGDVVKLKSGGPKMTVVAVDEAEFTGERTAWCEWFDKGPIAKSATFSLVALTKWPPPEGPRIIRNDSGTTWMSN